LQDPSCVDLDVIVSVYLFKRVCVFWDRCEAKRALGRVTCTFAVVREI
jgi:hypothetical protein